MKRQGLEDEDLSDKMRLDKLLALLGEGTRSEIKAMVRAGRVTVDGRAAKDAGMQVCGETDDIRLDGRALYYKAVRHVMLNKPSGVLTAARDKKQPTVLDFPPPEYPAIGCMPGGRLDMDTTGLLLLTTDGELNHRLLAPARHVDKTYLATLDKPVGDKEVAVFASGLSLSDFEAAPADLTPLPGNQACVTIHEGKFHQVKRMTASLGAPVLYLKRLSMGPLRLDPALECGKWRYLTKEEEDALLSLQ